MTRVRRSTLLYLFLGLTVAATGAHAVPITSLSYFDQVGDVIIDFETLSGSSDQVAEFTSLTSQYDGLLFSSESTPHALQTTDPGDLSGRFDAPVRILPAISGGGVPTSGVRYMSGDSYLGLYTSDIRIDFLFGVTAVGFHIVDNDYTDVRVQAFDAAGNVLDTVIVPEVGGGGVTYAGIAAQGISYVIIDGANGTHLDSTFIDDLSFRPVPVPAALPLMLTALGALGLSGRRRR